MTLREGDKVIVEPKAEEDCTLEAWEYIKNNPFGIVRRVFGSKPASMMYAIEFNAPFAGGIDCMKSCKPGQGHFVMPENVSLCFEDSRDVITVPKIEVGDEA